MNAQRLEAKLQSCSEEDGAGGEELGGRKRTSRRLMEGQMEGNWKG